MESIKEMLKQEIRKSRTFTKQNFGLMNGEDFPDVVKGMLSSDTVIEYIAGTMVQMMVGSAQAGVEAHENGGMQGGAEGCRILATAFQNNLSSVKGFAEMFYWGIQVGRKLEQAEGVDKALAGIMAATEAKDVSDGTEKS